MGEMRWGGYRWTLEYIGNSRDDSSTPQHHLATLNSAAAASAATETMSEEASAAGDVQWRRGGRSPHGPVRETLSLSLASTHADCFPESSCVFILICHILYEPAYPMSCVVVLCGRNYLSSARCMVGL